MEEQMNKSQAIRLKCLDCSDNRPKEVTLCTVFDCGLYPFRFGCSDKSKKYKERIEKAKRRYPEEYKEMQKLLSDASIK